MKILLDNFINIVKFLKKNFNKDLNVCYFTILFILLPIILFL